MNERLLSSAEAAKRVGVTAKALRLYEERGLISPMRNRAGWRCYGSAQISRLHQIIALKRLGLSLADIAELLKGNVDKLNAVLTLQERALTGESQKIHHALALVRAAKEKLALGALLSLDDLTTLTLETTALTPLWEKHFTRAELDAIARRNDREDAFFAAWRQLLDEIKIVAQKGDPCSPEALALGRRWLVQSERYIGGDHAFGQKLKAFSADAMSDPAIRTSAPFTREIYDFLVKVIAQIQTET